MERGYQLTEDDDPRHLYDTVLVALDSSRGLNNGEPSSAQRRFGLYGWINFVRAGDCSFRSLLRYRVLLLYTVMQEAVPCCWLRSEMVSMRRVSFCPSLSFIVMAPGRRNPRNSSRKPLEEGDMAMFAALDATHTFRIRTAGCMLPHFACRVRWSKTLKKERFEPAGVHDIAER